MSFDSYLSKEFFQMFPDIGDVWLSESYAKDEAFLESFKVICGQVQIVQVYHRDQTGLLLLTPQIICHLDKDEK